MMQGPPASATDGGQFSLDSGVAFEGLPLCTESVFASFTLESFGGTQPSSTFELPLFTTLSGLETSYRLFMKAMRGLLNIMQSKSDIFFVKVLGMRLTSFFGGP
ncbi:MAG: hypothetical protein GY822_01155 [Deltaproteobacteria bacterium]|nr:hypothetical protein [Deltaproteobacteria bacterium]